MAPTRRYTAYLPEQSEVEFLRICSERALTPSACIRLATGLLRIAHDAERAGRHVGVVSDPAKLDTLILAPV